MIVFDTPLTAELNVTGTRFQVRLAPSNAAGNGSLKLKSGALAYETSSGAKLSVAGIASPRINPQRLNLAKFQTVIASSTAGQYRASYLTDGVTGNDNRWQGSGSQWQAAQVDFPFAVEVGSAQVFMGVDDASAMSTIYLQHFNGSTWVMIPGVPPLGDFVLKYWDGTAWQNLAGATVTGNSAADRIVSFTTPIITSKVRLEFTNPGTTAIRELCIFPANTGNTGYPIGTNIIDSGKIAQYEDYHDAFYRITHPSSGRYMAVPSGGQPALDQAGVTTEQGHYQVLLNLSNGTYRLRNRATGDCLSGAQLAKTPGLPLTDAPYLALPHQDWILETLGGGNFQLVNQWSGLAIDTQGAATSPGTVLVQNTADQSPTQRWRFSYSTWSPRKASVARHSPVLSRRSGFTTGGWRIRNPCRPMRSFIRCSGATSTGSSAATMVRTGNTTLLGDGVRTPSTTSASTNRTARISRTSRSTAPSRFGPACRKWTSRC